MSEPSALLSYLSIIQKLPTYGVHYYDVKDQNNYAQILGITPTGIAVYDAMDKVKYVRVHVRACVRACARVCVCVCVCVCVVTISWAWAYRVMNRCTRLVPLHESGSIV